MNTNHLEIKTSQEQCPLQVEPFLEVLEEPPEDWTIDLELLGILQSVGELSKQVIPSPIEV